MTLLPAPPAADSCPVCHADHWTPGPWPACATHGHRLQPHHISPDGRVNYTCPATYPSACPISILGPAEPPREEPPMTVTPVVHQPTSDIAIRDGQEFWTKKQLAALRQLGVDNAPHADLAVFFHRCQATGLDPFSKQICMIKRREKRGSGYVDKWTIQTEIDGYRLIGHRAARRDGKTISKPAPVWYDAEGNTYPAWFRPGPPAAAKAIILVDGQPFEGVASYAEFVQLKDGKPTTMWAKMPANQTAKCAEAQAWRAAFPADFRLQGVEFTADPMPTAEPAAAAETWHAAAIQDADDHAEVAAIQGHYDRLGIEDAGERLNLTAMIAGANFIPDGFSDLSREELERAAKALHGCRDISQVHALLDRGDKPGGDAA